MSVKKKEKEQAEDEYEEFLYPTVCEFFSGELDCDIVGSASESPISLSVFGGRLIPDVYGTRNSRNSNYEIFMAEGKLDFSGRDFDICKGQALSLQRFADFVYMFFPQQSWNRLQEEEQEDILDECKKLGIGLLLIDEKNANLLVAPHRNEDLLDENKRLISRNLITDYFPNFTAPEENKPFFKKFTNLALNIAIECFEILEEEAKSVFKEVIGAKQASIRIWPDVNQETFQFYIMREWKKIGAIYLTTNPFGHPSEINEPVLVIEQYFYEDYLKKGVSTELIDYLFRIGKEGAIINIETDKKTINLDKSDEIVKFVSKLNKQIKTISIFKPITLVGKERKIIALETKHALTKMYEFTKQLKVTHK